MPPRAPGSEPEPHGQEVPASWPSSLEPSAAAAPDRSPALAVRGPRLSDMAWRAAYDGVALPLARVLLPLAGLLNGKIAAWRAEREGWRVALDTALATRPDLALGDALWVHASSAGEFLQARALLAELRARRPELPLVYTYSSPSARPLLHGFRGADLVLPLPFDTRVNARAWLDRLRPAALALVDAELWPSFIGESLDRGLPVALVSARRPTDSPRARFPLRSLYAGMLRRFALVACVEAAAAEVLRFAGVHAERLRVTGDLRVDETLRRAREPASLDLPLPPILPTLVAGSTWPGDEVVLFRAVEELRDRGVPLGLAVAPHEVDERRLESVERRLEEHGFTPARWSRLTMPEELPALPAPPLPRSPMEEPQLVAGRDSAVASDPAASPRLGGALSTGSRAQQVEAAVVDAVLVDRVGILHRLYGGAAAAWVGGAFRGRVHNLMEPAACGVPVVTGPRIGRSWIARELVRACAVFPVADREAAAAVLGHLLADRDAGREAGARGRDVLEQHAGAARRTVEALEEAGWLPQARAVARDGLR